MRELSRDFANADAVLAAASQVTDEDIAREFFSYFDPLPTQPAKLVTPLTLRCGPPLGPSPKSAPVNGPDRDLFLMSQAPFRRLIPPCLPVWLPAARKGPLPGGVVRRPPLRLSLTM